MFNLIIMSLSILKSHLNVQVYSNHVFNTTLRDFYSFNHINNNIFLWPKLSSLCLQVVIFNISVLRKSKKKEPDHLFLELQIDIHFVPRYKMINQQIIIHFVPQSKWYKMNIFELKFNIFLYYFYHSFCTVVQKKVVQNEYLPFLLIYCISKLS